MAKTHYFIETAATEYWDSFEGMYKTQMEFEMRQVSDEDVIGIGGETFDGLKTDAEYLAWVVRIDALNA